MYDRDKNKEQLIEELRELRKRLVELEGTKLPEPLELIVFNAPIGFFIIQNGKFKLVNPEFQKITDYSEDELLGRDCMSLVAPEFRKKVRANTIKMLKEKTSIPFDFKFFPKSGEAKWCMQKVISMQYEGERAILGYFMDITEKKQAEEALRRSYNNLEERIQERTAELMAANRTLDAVIHASPEPILAIDPEGNIQLWNPAAERVFGWQKEEVMGQMNPIIPPEKQEEFRVLRERELRGEAFHDLEIRRCKKDGSPIDLSLSSAPIRDAEGRITGIMGILSDITARKQMEEALRQSEEKYRYIFETANEVIWVLNAKFETVLVNQKVSDLLGYTPAEMNGLSPGAFIFPEDREKYQILVDRHLQGREEPFDFRLRHKDGSVRWVHLKTKRILDANGSFAGSFAMLDDITARKCLEQDLVRSKTLFESIFNSITDTAIFADTNRRILMVNTAAEDTFGYSPEEMKGKTTEFLYIDKEAYEEQGIRRFRIGADKSLPIYEINYRRKDGSAFPAETMGTFVEDPQGNILGFIGIIRDISERKMAEEERERMISELQKALAQVKTLKGLLPICAYCKRIRDDEGYWNSVEKYIHDRSEVEFSHGICPDCLKEHHPSFKEAKLPFEKEKFTEISRGKGRILVMDDEETVREVVSKFLEKLGYEVIGARNGIEAIDLYKQAKDSNQPFAAVILDLTVPDKLGGKETIEQLIVVDPQIKAIVTSGYLDDQIMFDFKKYGFSGAIAKPYRIFELNKVLQRVMNE
jgi:PAS domain S-box-containing protein